MAINQRQIASTLNLSVATISRSLKNDRAINPRTRALVQETARQMGYEVPSVQNYIDESNCKPFCAVIQTDAIPYIKNESPNNLLPGYMTGMSEAAFREHTSMIVHYVPLDKRDHAADPKLLPRALTSGAAEGVILVHYFPDDVVKEFSDKFSCVSLSYNYRLPHMDVVSEDNTNGISVLMQHLFDNGHRQIAFVSRDTKYYYTHRARLSGFMSGILELDLKENSEYIYNIDEAGAAKQLIADIKDKKFTALICAGDELGYDCQAALQKEGISVPENISLVSFDSLPAPKGLKQLTSMKIPSDQIGIAAVSVLKKRIANPAMPAQRILIDCTFVKGETVKSI